MFRKFDVIFLSFFSYFTFLRTLMYQFFAAIVRVAALRRESQLGPTHFSWKNTYVFTYFFSWIFLKCMDAPWGALGALGRLFGGSGADNWSQKRILGSIISSLVMKLYVCWWTCLCMCIHFVLWVCVGEYIQTYIDVHICMCESIYIHNLCIDAYLQICRYTSMHIYLYIYIYIHI